MVDFNRALLQARKLINKNGRLVSFVKVGGLSDTNKPLHGSAEVTVPNIRACFIFPSGFVELGHTKEMFEGLWEQIEQIALVAYDGTNDFSSFHKILDRGTEHKIIRGYELAPADLPIMYYIGTRR